MPVLDTPPIPRKLYRSLWGESTWEPHDMQREILLDPTRNKVVALGRRAGKSQTGGRRLVPEAFRTWYELDRLRALSQRREYWIVGPEYSDSEKEFRTVWNELKRLGFTFDKPGSYNNPESGEMIISMFDRRFIVAAKSAKYPGTLVGEGLSGVIMAEAAKMKLSVWHKYIRPTLADFNGWSMFNSTPEGKNWFYDLYMIGLDPRREDWKSWRAPSWVNHHVYPGGVNEEFMAKAIEMRRRHKFDSLLLLYKQISRSGKIRFRPTREGRVLKDKNGEVIVNEEIWSMFLDMSLEMFNQEIAALFTEFVGRVFKDFDEEIHVTPQEYQPHWQTFACADYGFTNPFAWLVVQVDPHGERVHVLDEYYEVYKTTKEAAAEIAARGLAPRTIRTFYPDPAEPDRTKDLAGILKLKPHSKGSIPLEDRLEWIRRGLKIDPRLGGAPSLTIHPRCANLIREMNNYKYPESAEKAGEKGRSAKEKPMDKDNHAPEALGRFYSGFFGRPWAGGPKQSQAKQNR
jgi:hypothetical protein